MSRSRLCPSGEKGFFADVRIRVIVCEGRPQGTDQGRTPCRVSVVYWKEYGVSPDESRPSGSLNLGGMLERALGEKRPKVGVQMESGCSKCAEW